MGSATLEDRTVGSLFALFGAAIMVLPITYLVRMAVFDNNPVNSWFPFWLAFGVGVYLPILSSSVGLLCVALIAWGSLMMSKRGKERRGVAILVACSLANLIFSGGGFFVGTIFVLIGGLLGYQSTKWDYSA
jgi:hypothetical protein